MKVCGFMIQIRSSPVRASASSAPNFSEVKRAAR